jgi:hypothetical protein
MTHEAPDDLQKAVDAYAGPITKCRPGKARGRNVKPRAMDRAEQWLKAHRAGQPKEDRHHQLMRSLRIEQQRQRERRDDRRDAPTIRQANKERRIADLRRKNKVGRVNEHWENNGNGHR